MAHPAANRDLRPVDPVEVQPPDAAAARSSRAVTRTRMAGLQAYALIAVAVVLVVGALKVAEGFFVPVVFSFVIALALAPLVRRMERLVPRWIASALVVSSLVGLLGFMSYSLSDEAAQVIASLPQATRTLRQALRNFARNGEGALSHLQTAATELQKTAVESSERPSTPTGVTPVQVVEPPVDFSNFLWLGSQGALLFAGTAILMAFLVYFLLASGDLFKRKLVRMSGNQLSKRKVTVQMIDQIGDRVAKSMLHLLIASTVVGVATFGLLTAFEVQYASLWGLAAGVLNCVPYVGPAVVAAGLMLAGVLQFGNVATAAMIAGSSLFVTTLEGFLFTPIVFGRSVSLNPVAIFVSFLFWGWMWGVAGMLLALPLLMIVKTVAESVEDLAPLAELLSD
jgi:predicted PurR-regulated permease PerM